MINLTRVSMLLLLGGSIALAEKAEAQPSADAANQWIKIDQGKTGARSGSVLVHAADLKQMLLVGTAKGAPFVQAFDPLAKTWSEFSAALPTKNGISPYYQTAYDPGTKTVYCLSGGPVLYAFNTADKMWKTFPSTPELDGLSWYALSCDTAGKRLVVVGSDKKADNLGWMRTVVFDIPSGKWQRLDVTDNRVVKEHQELVTAKEAMIDLIGHIRSVWYRDPKGIGSNTELAALGARCAALKKLPRMDKFAADIDGLAGSLDTKNTLDALKAARVLQRQFEEVAEAQYPVPCSRRNSPLVYDSKSKVFVLFGGDHEDYLMNDTWVLDLETKGWRRAKPGLSPSPRAGHALVELPGCGKVALYEGYIQSNNTDYAATPYRPLDPLQLWLYDTAAERWDLAGNWPLPGKGEPAGPTPVGHFEGYARERFSPELR